jgi:thiol-disulfide isomerase/thioredoxin
VEDLIQEWDGQLINGILKSEEEPKSKLNKMLDWATTFHAEMEKKRGCPIGNLAIEMSEHAWCPDCKRLNMFIDEITEENQDKQWFKIDKDEFPEIAEEQKVMGIPSLLVFKNGEKLAHLHSANAKTPDEVREFLKTL